MLATTLVALLTAASLTNASAVKLRKDVDMILRWASDAPADAVTVTVTEPCSATEMPSASTEIAPSPVPQGTIPSETTEGTGIPASATEVPLTVASSGPTASGTEAPATGSAAPPASIVPGTSAIVSSIAAASSSVASAGSSAIHSTPVGTAHPSGTASTAAPVASSDGGDLHSIAGLAIAAMVANAVMGVA